MDAFDLPDLLRRQGDQGSQYLEFLRSDALSVGLYVLPAGGHDPQQPHGEDEVYYVAQGSAIIHVGGEDRPVHPGSIVFVAAGVEHRFHSIDEALTVVVFFAPPEYSGRVEPGR